VGSAHAAVAAGRDQPGDAPWKEELTSGVSRDEKGEVIPDFLSCLYRKAWGQYPSNCSFNGTQRREMIQEELLDVKCSGTG